MANETVTCPQCGSTDTTEYRTNAFICGHCEAKFRWRDPAAVNVKTATCSCGKAATAVCTQCDIAICDAHHGTAKSLYADYTGWAIVKSILLKSQPGMRDVDSRSHDFKARLDPGGWAPYLGDIVKPPDLSEVGSNLAHTKGHFGQEKKPSHVLHAVQEQLAKYDPMAVLCVACLGEIAFRLFPAIERQMASFVDGRPICHRCPNIVNVDSTCAECGLPVCSGCSVDCPKCKRCWCKGQAWKGCYEGHTFFNHQAPWWYSCPDSGAECIECQLKSIWTWSAVFVGAVVILGAFVLVVCAGVFS